MCVCESVFSAAVDRNACYRSNTWQAPTRQDEINNFTREDREKKTERKEHRTVNPRCLSWRILNQPKYIYDAGWNCIAWDFFLPLQSALYLCFKVDACQCTKFSWNIWIAHFNHFFLSLFFFPFLTFSLCFFESFFLFFILLNYELRSILRIWISNWEELNWRLCYRKKILCFELEALLS